MPGKTVLVIDDEAPIRALLEITLSGQGYQVTGAATGREGLALAASVQPACILLDLGLPDIDGFDVLARLREWFQRPVLILSVRSAEEDIIRALDHGANDYLTKPFRTGEMLARVRSALRRTRDDASSPVVEVGPLTVDLENHLVRKNGTLLKLTPTEFSLLALFVNYEGRVLTHSFILKEIRGMGFIDQTQYLRVFIAQIRKKIEDDPQRPRLLVTESGIGYRLGSG